MWARQGQIRHELQSGASLWARCQPTGEFPCQYKHVVPALPTTLRRQPSTQPRQQPGAPVELAEGAARLLRHILAQERRYYPVLHRRIDGRLRFPLHALCGRSRGWVQGSTQGRGGGASACAVTPAHAFPTAPQMDAGPSGQPFPAKAPLSANLLDHDDGVVNQVADDGVHIPSVEPDLCKLGGLHLIG